jgi:hypothetical protein
MPHRHAPRLAGIILALLAPAAGCIVSGGGNDPGPAFVSGAGGTGTSAYGGTYGTVRADASGAAGATRDAGAAGTDGATRDAGAASDAGADGSASKSLACTVGATGTFTFAWSLEDGAGAPSTCDAVAGQTVDIDIVNLSTGAEASTTVPCAALAATSCAMQAGGYSLSMKLRNAAGTVLAEITAPTLLLVNGRATPVASLPFQVGGADAASGRGVALTWAIEQVDTKASETCAAAGAMTVRVVVGTKHFDLPCADGKGRTTALPPGASPVTLHLLDAQGADLSVTQTMTISVGAGQLVFLGDVVFDVI